MKNLKKLSIAIVVTIFCSTLFSNCSDDITDETASSPGYFTIDGVKHDLHSAYNTYYELTDDIHPGSVKYIQSEVAFISEGLSSKNGEPTGSGDLVLFECQDPLNQQIPGPGDYTYLSDSKPVTPYTYFGFLYNQGIGSAESKDYWLRETVKVKKSGDVYEFSSSGKTQDGKPFEFYYKGEILAKPM